MPVLREASQILRQPPKSMGDLTAWDAPLFPLFPPNARALRSMQKAIREELKEKNAHGSSGSGQQTPSAPVLGKAVGGTQGADTSPVEADQSKENPITIPATAPVVPEDHALTPLSKSPADPAPVSDPYV